MKPSVQDATHYDRIFNAWYKFGETACYYWSHLSNGWKVSMLDPQVYKKECGFITAQEALEQGCKYPQYPTTTEGVIVDSTPSGDVLEASETKVADESDLQRKISEAISDYPFITFGQLDLLRDNGYKVDPVGIFKDGVLQAKPREQTARSGAVYASAEELKEKWEQRMSSDVYKKWVDDLNNWSTPSMFINEPLIPDMTEANDKKVNTTSANNRQVGGDHYKKMRIQPWDLFSGIFNLDEQVGFYLGNVYKYLMRYDSKNGIQDLEKAKHYLEKLIEVKRGAASADVGDK